MVVIVTTLSAALATADSVHAKNLSCAILKTEDAVLRNAGVTQAPVHETEVREYLLSLDEVAETVRVEPKSPAEAEKDAFLDAGEFRLRDMGPGLKSFCQGRCRIVTTETEKANMSLMVSPWIVDTRSNSIQGHTATMFSFKNAPFYDTFFIAKRFRGVCEPMG